METGKRNIVVYIYTALLLSICWIPAFTTLAKEAENKTIRKRFVPAIIAGAYITEALWTALLAGTTVYGAYTASQLISAGVRVFRGRQHHQGCSYNGWGCEDVGCNRDGGSCNSVKYRKSDGKIGTQCQCLYFH